MRSSATSLTLIIIASALGCQPGPGEAPVTPSATAAPSAASQASAAVLATLPSAPATQAAPADPAALASAPLRPMVKPSAAEDTPLPDRTLGALKVGMRVRITGRDRALKPDETGHTASVALGPGQIGTVERFVKRKLSGYEFNIAVVRWDAQIWHEWDIPFNRMKEGVVYTGADINRMNDTPGPGVALGPIETAAHPEMLEEVK